MSKAKRARTDRGSLSGAAVGVLLGSGLGAVSDEFSLEASVPFADIPGLTGGTVAGHRCAVSLAAVGARKCLLIEGRKHHYEGDDDQVRTLVAFVVQAGVRELVVTCASGSLDPALPPGQLVLVSDIIDLQMRRPGYPPQVATQSRRSPRIRGGLHLDPRVGARLEDAARTAGVSLGRGVMACNAGPAYETPAEIEALRRLGASVVTMSGAPEIGHSRELGIAVACVVLVTNWASGITMDRLTHDEVLEAAGAAVDPLRRIVRLFVEGTTG